MKIRIKTPLIEIEITDNPTITDDGYTKRSMPEFPSCIKSAVMEAINLHNAVENDKNQST